MDSEYADFMSSYAMQNTRVILDYIAYDLCNPQAASSMLKTIFGKLSNLACFPRTGRMVDNSLVQGGSVRSILVKKYVVYYQVKDDSSEVYILAVTYNRNYHNVMMSELLDALQGGYSIF
ncbi:MAG: type II toxin-antitoxin system RelE/ParE family toxin [Clostridia bacterium]|nr:type II toxin-antitoxin system RelE/ParE family toxin [Clostridia bacterium]